MCAGRVELASDWALHTPMCYVLERSFDSTDDFGCCVVGATAVHVSHKNLQEEPVCSNEESCAASSLSQNDSHSSIANDPAQQSDRVAEQSDRTAQTDRALLPGEAAQVSDQALPSDRPAQPGSNVVSAPGQLTPESELDHSLRTALDSHLSVLMVLDPNSIL